MHIAHLPPCFKGLMQLKGEKKEVTVTDKYQHTPKPSGQSSLKQRLFSPPGDYSQPLTRWEEEDWGENETRCSGIHLMSVKFLAEWYTHWFPCMLCPHWKYGCLSPTFTPTLHWPLLVGNILHPLYNTEWWQSQNKSWFCSKPLCHYN